MEHLFTLYVVATSLVTIASVIANYTDTLRIWETETVQNFINRNKE
jgi:hypothetical protein